jgi:3-hydroxyanthranilate 3,4-dioxygenase
MSQVVGPDRRATVIPYLQTFNVEEYFRSHANDWGPRPVRVIWESFDYITLLVRGPSMGKEFHVGRGEEIFYQVRGELCFHYVDEDGARQLIHLNQGESFLLPAKVPHSPRRPDESSWTLVIERRPRPDDEDFWIWFCERCNHKLYESSHRYGSGPGNQPNTIVRDAVNLLRSDENLRTCAKCDEVLSLGS